MFKSSFITSQIHFLISIVHFCNLSYIFVSVCFINNENKQQAEQICIQYRYPNGISVPGVLRGHAVRTGSFILADVPINQPDTDGDPGCPHSPLAHTHLELLTPSYCSFVEKLPFCSESGGSSLSACLSFNTHTGASSRHLCLMKCIQEKKHNDVLCHQVDNKQLISFDLIFYHFQHSAGFVHKLDIAVCSIYLPL